MAITKTLHALCLRLPLAASMLGTLPATAAALDAPLYQRPALHSELAARSLMLDVTRAGRDLVAVGERGFILRSQDNGQNWQQVPSPVSVTLTQVTFPTPSQGWAVGHAGIILHSDDAGRSWTTQLDGSQAAQLALDAATAAYAEHHDTEHQQRLEEARQLVDDGPDKPLLAVHFFDAQRGLAVGAYGLALATTDGGRHWRSVSQQLDNPSALHLYDILDLDGTLFIAAEQGLLLRSTDQGEHFSAVQIPTSGTLFGLLASEDNSLLVFGLRGKILRSDDRGNSWQAVDNDQPITLTAGARGSDGTLLLVDETGRVLSSQDQGRHFRASGSNASSLTSLSETADGRFMLSGVRGLTPFSLQDGQRSSAREQ
ncbi:WD40/YVTN/BNR-like repeat-containing protein [Pseudomonas sp. BNK-15]|uniref:WD40/YVTN/BNR-like repeat-containing protein n=1 Tax=Pseudomonas sp. BNK-15 TaxID=3376152 RepID=UPI0039BF9562